MRNLTGPLDAIRQSDYTGDNRCIPCTLVNLGIAIVLSILVGAGVSILFNSTSLASLGGVGTFIIGCGAIYARGYLVPYTPTLTKRYFPDRVLRWFDKGSHNGFPDGQDDRLDDLNLELELQSLGVVGECDEVDDLCLEETFRKAWRNRIRSVRDVDDERYRELVIEALGRKAEGGEVRIHEGSSMVVSIANRRIGQWESRAALTAELAADQVLREIDAGWKTYSDAVRSQLLGSLRMFLKWCPACEGSVSLSDETIESCCRSKEVIGVRCDKCGARIFEVDITPDLAKEM